MSMHSGDQFLRLFASATRKAERPAEHIIVLFANSREFPMCAAFSTADTGSPTFERGGRDRVKA